MTDTSLRFAGRAVGVPAFFIIIRSGTLFRKFSFRRFIICETWCNAWRACLHDAHMKKKKGKNYKRMRLNVGIRAVAWVSNVSKTCAAFASQSQNAMWKMHFNNFQVHDVLRTNMLRVRRGGLFVRSHYVLKLFIAAAAAATATSPSCMDVLYKCPALA